MERILLVEDEKFFADVISMKLQSDPELSVTRVSSLKEAQQATALDKSFDLAILDLFLPDAMGLDIANCFSSQSTPFLVFTSSYEPTLQDNIYDLGAIDYIIKDSPQSLDYLMSIIQRVKKTKALRRW